MFVVRKQIRATPGQIFAILADGWSYAGWVVGTSHIRAVDEGWPAPGNRIHHAVGPWPVLIRDTTTVLDIEPDRRLRMGVRIWPIGEAEVELLLDPAPGSSSDSGTLVTMTETPTAGPGRFLGPAGSVLLALRNTESLSRLALRAEHTQR
ncbi:SRPBCC family protein [soil metagenome]